ncbi:MAG: hypothetical protein JRE65_00380 [Deltaproteobacteria bacterium]|jgi:hypothetical protein|nr:hypothetical protein [Deltaproteobacteria bacterium]
MSKFTIAGLVSWFIGGLLFGFQALDSLISSGGGGKAWKNLTLIDVIDKSHFSWVNGMSEGIIHNAAQYIIAMPIYLLLFCVGILFLILGRLTTRF